MGVNGAGKSTILHALACAYNPSEDGDARTTFPQFFKKDSFESWEGTRFTLTYIDKGNKEAQTVCSRTKTHWSRYDRRPARNVVYMGIDTCVPDVEKEKYDNIRFSEDFTVIKKVEKSVLKF